MNGKFTEPVRKRVGGSLCNVPVIKRVAMLQANSTLLRKQCQIDVFTVMSGRTYPEVVADADVFPIRGREIRFASKKSLIGWKERSVREKDKLDAMALRKLQKNPAAFD